MVQTPLFTNLRRKSNYGSLWHLIVIHLQELSKIKRAAIHLWIYLPTKRPQEKNDHTDLFLVAARSE